MKKYLITEALGALFVGLVSVVFLLGYFLYQSFFYQDPLMVGIPPRENADGTIDYTLVNKWLYDKEPTYWNYGATPLN